MMVKKHCSNFVRKINQQAVQFTATLVLLSASAMSDVGHCQGHSSVQGWLWILYFIVNAMLLISQKNQIYYQLNSWLNRKKTAHNFDAALALLTGESAAREALLHSWRTAQQSKWCCYFLSVIWSPWILSKEMKNTDFNTGEGKAN